MTARLLISSSLASWQAACAPGMNKPTSNTDGPPKTEPIERSPHCRASTNRVHRGVDGDFDRDLDLDLRPPTSDLDLGP